MISRAVAGGLLFFIGLPGPVSAQNRWAREVADQLHRALSAANAQSAGSPRLNTTGTLNQEESATFSVTLQQGRHYSVIAVCDNDCSRLRLVVATPTNSELALERSSEGFPVIQFSPPVSAAYRIRVSVEECRVNPCWFAVGIVPR
jgi:hypothetical protein